MQDLTPLPHPYIILDTDAGPDGDDTAALAMLLNYANEGKIDLLSAVSDTSSPYGASYLRALCLAYGHPEVKIGTMKSRDDIMPTARGNSFNIKVTANYYTDLPDGIHAPDALDIYRETLAGAPDASVTIVAIGMQTNLADLLRSKPDRHSKLDGIELVRRKVRLVSAMAGQWPEGREFNIENDIEAARVVAELCPVPILYSGYTVGEGIKTGPDYDKIEPDSPLRVAWWHMNSWDQTSVIAAVEGIDELWTVRRGFASIDSDGRNHFAEAPDGNRCYLVEDESRDSEIAAKITALANAPRLNRDRLTTVSCAAAEDCTRSDGWTTLTGVGPGWREGITPEELKRLHVLNNTQLVTEKSGERLELDFEGSELLIYGGRGVGFGGFEVHVDGRRLLSVDCRVDTEPKFASQLLLRLAELGEGSHRLELVSSGKISLDFIKSVLRRT